MLARPMITDSCLLRRPRAGFAAGRTEITRGRESVPGLPGTLGIGFEVWRLAAGEEWRGTTGQETAWVLLRGEASLQIDGATQRIARRGVFEDPPATLHAAAGAVVSFRAESAQTEFAVAQTPNELAFAPRLFRPDEIAPEYRGAGLVQNACLRDVRLIFDRTARPGSNLVVGEVLNYPGRWSSYPPHHHDQPEIYHYRFTADDGYGHAEIGDDVVKVRDGDTLVIPPGRDHAQVAAPGYGMYYLWVIRHLPANPYTGFTFAEEHKWTLDPAQQGWRPDVVPKGFA